MLAGPLIGTVYFWLVYLLAEAACAEELELADQTLLRLVVLAGAVAAAAILVILAWRADRLRRSDTIERDEREVERFMATTGLMLLGLFVLFVAFLALPVIGMSLC